MSDSFGASFGASPSGSEVILKSRLVRYFANGIHLSHAISTPLFLPPETYSAAGPSNDQPHARTIAEEGLAFQYIPCRCKESNSEDRELPPNHSERCQRGNPAGGR